MNDAIMIGAIELIRMSGLMILSMTMNKLAAAVTNFVVTTKRTGNE